MINRCNFKLHVQQNIVKKSETTTDTSVKVVSVFSVVVCLIPILNYSCLLFIQTITDIHKHTHVIKIFTTIL